MVRLWVCEVNAKSIAVVCIEARSTERRHIENFLLLFPSVEQQKTGMQRGCAHVDRRKLTAMPRDANVSTAPQALDNVRAQ